MRSETPAAAAERRRVLVAFLAFGAWWGAWGAVLPAIQRSAGVSDSELGTALLFVGVGALASMRATGSLIDRFGPLVLPATLVLFALLGILPAVAAGVVALTAALFFVGAGSGAADVALNTASARYEALTGGSVMNLAHAMFSIGVVASSLGTGLLRGADIGPGGVLTAAGATVVIIGLLTLRRSDTASQGAAEAGAARPSWPWWRPPTRLLVIGFLAALAYLLENAWQSWSAVHLERNLHAPPALSAMGPAAFATFAATGRLLGHRLTRRVSPQWLVRGGAALATAGTLVAATAPSVALVLAGIAAAGLGTAVCAPTLFSVAAQGVAPTQRGAVVGSVTTVAYLGFVFAPAVVGFTAGVTTLRIALGACAVAGLVLAAAAGRARPA